LPPSGARTMPNLGKQDEDLDAATTEINVSRSSVLHEANVGAVLDDLEEHSSVIAPSASAASTRAEDGPRLQAGNFLLALLVLIAAGGAAAVVYFALPYLT
jgi:hypothetical protein